jgi:lipopolysaccharide/colanic/teichoic acid biosynthesis glycosyltransferase
MSRPLSLQRHQLPPAALRSIPDTRRLAEVLNVAQTAAAVRRERARADRAGTSFSLVVFRLDEPGRRGRNLLRLCKILLETIRIADEIGRYDARSVCAVLPDTNAGGAQTFVDRVNELAMERMKAAPFSVIYTYPTDDPGRGGGEPAQPANAGAAKASDASAVGHTAARAILPAAPVLPMETLFAKPTPWWKRAIDIAVSGTAILIASPLLIAIALAIKLTSKGPVVFTQRRAGLGGQPFVIYKFRTMVVDAEARKAALRAQSEQDGPAFKIKRDPRITFVGGFLRSTSLDELPQLFNILLGDMSLVGPRPLPIDEQNGCDLWHRKRLDVVPGLTCIWQVEGRSRVTFEEWMRMDMAYIRSRRMLTELFILLKTVPAVLLRRGAS